MPSSTISELNRLAATLEAGHRALLEHARRIAEPHGWEVLDVRTAGEDGMLEVRVRIPGRIAESPARAGNATGLRTVAAAGPPEPAFVSPVRTSAPFDGDGTTDVLRFIAEADPVVIVPGREAQGDPVALRPEERVRMLAGTIAGDVLLSLEHQGRLLDADAVAAGLRQGRDHYGAEIERAGLGGAGQEWFAHYDSAAASVRRQLGAA